MFSLKCGKFEVELRSKNNEILNELFLTNDQKKIFISYV